jgi:hypothetical protein
MTIVVPEKDLIVLAADEQIKFAVKGLLARGPAMGFREPIIDLNVHPAKDPGCLLRGHEFLRASSRQYRHAIVLFDREGCGKEHLSREELEREVEHRLASSGWADRAAAVVLDPELEVWVWSDSPQVDAVLGWAGRTPQLAQWLEAQGYRAANQPKPNEPKKALEHALRSVRKARSSVIFHELAQHVSIKRCTDPSFLKFKALLQQWFGLNS